MISAPESFYKICKNYFIEWHHFKTVQWCHEPIHFHLPHLMKTTKKTGHQWGKYTLLIKINTPKDAPTQTTEVQLPQTAENVGKLEHTQASIGHVYSLIIIMGIKEKKNNLLHL